jgi:hypothetical protein
VAAAGGWAMIVFNSSFIAVSQEQKLSTQRSQRNAEEKMIIGLYLAKAIWLCSWLCRLLYSTLSWVAFCFSRCCNFAILCFLRV